MSKSTTLRIGDHVTIIPGFPFDSSHFRDAGGIPLVRIRDLISETTEAKYDGSYNDRYLVDSGDILVGMDGDFNVAKWKGTTALLNQRIIKIIGRTNGEIDISFLYFFLKPFLIEINNRTPQTTVKHLSVADVALAWIDVPNLAKQRKIATILSTLDDLIEKTETLVAKYQAVKQGMMQDLFTRGVNEDAKLRPHHAEAPHLYKPSPLGWIPKEWQCNQVHDHISRIEQGWSPECDSEPATEGEWGVLKTTSVVWEGFNGNENKRLPKNLKPVIDYEVRVGDVLMTRGGPNSRVGVVAYVEDVQKHVMLSDKIYRIVPLSSVLNRYLALALSSNSTQAELSTQKTGLAESQTNISQEILRHLWIAVPGRDEQNRIVGRYTALASRIQAEKQLLQKYSVVKSGLMHDLLTGKVRVNVDPAEEAVDD